MCKEGAGGRTTVDKHEHTVVKAARAARASAGRSRAGLGGEVATDPVDGEDYELEEGEWGGRLEAAVAATHVPHGHRGHGGVGHAKADAGKSRAVHAERNRERSEMAAHDPDVIGTGNVYHHRNHGNPNR